MKKLLLLLLAIPSIALTQPVPPSIAIMDHRYAKLAGGSTIAGTTTFTNISVLGTCGGCLAVGSVTDTNASLAVKPSCGVVAASNVTLSGVQTIDGQLGSDGVTIVLATAQTSGTENGPWIERSTAWTRPTWYPSGGTTQAFQFITTFIRLGSTYSGTTWRMTTSGTITIDTTATTWAEAVLQINASSVASGATLVAPALGTPASVTLTNATGLPVSTGVSGLATGIATFLATPSGANLASAVTDETGSGLLVFSNAPTLVGPALGTPTSGVLTNATGLPIGSGVSGLGAGIATFLATPSSANFAAALTDETGSGPTVFATSPTITGLPLIQNAAAASTMRFFNTSATFGGYLGSSTSFMQISANRNFAGMPDDATKASAAINLNSAASDGNITFFTGTANDGTIVQALKLAKDQTALFASTVTASGFSGITATTCANQFISAISTTGSGTCTGLTLAGAQFANQGTTTTVLHGAAAGNPSFGPVALADMATQATNTVLVNATSGTATPTAQSISSCSSASSALIWTTNAGFGCNSSVTASTATTATNATNTAITDDTTTNATMYPTWVTTASSNQTQKVSSTKLSFNPSTGNLTATTHTGAVVATTITASSTITPSSTNGIVGTTTNDNANTGSIGEYQSAQLANVSATSLVNDTTKTVTSKSLTAGDWDCVGSVSFSFAATTTYKFVLAGLSTTDNTLGAQGTYLALTGPATTAPGTTTQLVYPTPRVRFLLSGTTTVYLVTQAEFATSTLTAAGDFGCRRMR